MYILESITISGTKAKLMVIGYILETLISMDGQGSEHFLANNTLLRDAARNFGKTTYYFRLTKVNVICLLKGMAYLEVCIESLRFKKVTTISTTTLDMSLGSIKAFIYEPVVEFGSFMREAESTITTISNYSVFSRLLNTNLYSSRDIQQVLFISGPEFKDEKEMQGNAENE